MVTYFLHVGFGIEPDSNYSQWKKAYGNLARHKEFTEMFRKYVEGEDLINSEV
jgi:hypothetical protein